MDAEVLIGLERYDEAEEALREGLRRAEATGDSNAASRAICVSSSFGNIESSCFSGVSGIAISERPRQYNSKSNPRPAWKGFVACLFLEESPQATCPQARQSRR